MRNYQRSVRIEDELQTKIESLPYGTFNNLVNNLVDLFFKDDSVKELVAIRDSRFKNWTPQQLKPMKPKQKEQKLAGLKIDPTAVKLVKSIEAIKYEPTPPPEHTFLDDLMPGL